MTKLLDCPFCGAPGDGYHFAYPGPLHACCAEEGCPAEGSEATAEVWNTRPTESALQEKDYIIQRLARALVANPRPCQCAAFREHGITSMDCVICTARAALAPQEGKP